MFWITSPNISNISKIRLIVSKQVSAQKRKQRVKKQPADQQKNIYRVLIWKGLLSRVYKELNNLKNPHYQICKEAYDLKRPFSKEIQLISRNRKNVQYHSLLKEMQIKTKIRHHLHNC